GHRTRRRDGGGRYAQPRAGQAARNARRLPRGGPCRGRSAGRPFFQGSPAPRSGAVSQRGTSVDLRLQFRMRMRAALAIVAVAGGLACAPVAAQEKTITMASTTSTEQSGLFAHLLPAFKQATGIEVRVVAVGTGQALDIGRRGDADVVFVHDTAA